MEEVRCSLGARNRQSERTLGGRADLRPARHLGLDAARRSRSDAREPRARHARCATRSAMTARGLRNLALHGLSNTKLAIAAAAALFAGALAALLLANVYVSRGYFADLKQTNVLKHRFAQLSERHTNRCGLTRVD